MSQCRPKRIDVTATRNIAPRVIVGLDALTEAERAAHAVVRSGVL